jgi:hypothetical protein
MSNRSLARLAPLIILVALAALVAGGAAPAQGASFTLDATHDAVDASPGDGVCADAGGACTLRAAVMETNALAGADEISLPAGTYVLSIAGAGEDASATGDLDITDALTLTGASSETTLIDGGGLDRVIHNSNESRPPASLTLQRVTVMNGNAHTGAGVFNDFGGDLVMRDTTVSENTAESPTKFGFGGGVANFATATLTNVVVSNNFSDFVGGGIYNALTFEARLTVAGSVISGNSVTWHGGGIFNSDHLVVRQSSILNNTADNSGGGIGMHAGRLEIEASLIARNSALNGGGMFSNGTILAWNNTINGNHAETGGGIYNESPGSLAAANVTISENTAAQGAGIRNAGFASPLNTIIVSSNTSTNCSGDFVSRGHNISSDNTCGFTAPGDISNTDPLLLPLADNGGPTQTHALRPPQCDISSCTPGSPAIDAGDNTACPGADQRGVARPFDGDQDGNAICDIGAHENDHGPIVCGCLPTSSPSPTVVPSPSPTPVLPVSLPATGGDAGSPNVMPAVAAVVVAVIVVAGGAVSRARHGRR